MGKNFETKAGSRVSGVKEIRQARRQAVVPPSTAITCPVISLDRWLQRKRTALAMSSSV